MFRHTLLAALLAISLCLRPTAAHADAGREFILSCTYGTLAGTLVGAAALSFTQKPGDSLNLIARGASLGLYAGILLGLYVVYGVSNDDDEEALKAVGGGSASLDYWRAPVERPRLQLEPLLTAQRGLEGFRAGFDVVRF